jgi:hypothetical protein
MSSETNFNDQWSKTVAHFDLNTASELHVELLKREENGKILLQIYRKSSEGEVIAIEQGIELPLAVFPELKRSITALEHAIKDENLTSSFKDPEENDLISDQRRASFAHESEREFARLLDFYRIDWRYEPRTFPIRWDEAGNIIESFTPDFYLPEQDQYIELTTLKQALVTKKNRKVRLLKTLYPEINIKIMYGKDYKRLIEKYAAKMTRNENGPK